MVNIFRQEAVVMQVNGNGLRGFMSGIMPSFQSVARQNNAFNPLSVFTQNNTDILNLSEMGKRLSFSRTESILELRGNPQISESDPVISLMEDSILEIEEILEKMYALATKAATDGSLSDLDRINMQIEMEDLRIDLMYASISMNDRFAQRWGNESNFMRCPHSGSSIGMGVMFGDFSTVLERARDRIIRGEKWDVAEGFRLYNEASEVRFKSDEGVMQILKPNEDGMIAAVLPENTPLIMNITREVTDGKHYILNDNERGTHFGAIPTVSEKLYSTDTIILMDPQSAARGVQRLRAEMERLQTMKKEIDVFKEGYVKQSGSGLDRARLLILRDEYMQVYRQMQTNFHEDKTGAENKKFLFTELGIMETGPDGAFPKLIRPSSPKGELFLKASNLFKSIADNLTQSGIAGVGFVTSNVWTNVDIQFSKAA
jgi:hypothetical protein